MSDIVPYFQNRSVTLYHGDCLEILPELDISFDACITDPPYGTTACKWDSIVPFEPMWKELNRLVKDNGAVCLFGSEPFSSALRMSNVRSFKYDWIWLKEKGLGFLNAKKMPLRDFEIISVFAKKTPLYNPQMRKGTPYTAKNNPDKQKGTNREYRQIVTVNEGLRYPCTTLRFNRVQHTVHPTQKPVELMEYLIKTYTNENDTVLDFCAGSGTTGIACMNTGRKCILIEKECSYCDIIVNRFTEKVC